MCRDTTCHTFSGFMVKECSLTLSCSKLNKPVSYSGMPLTNVLNLTSRPINHLKLFGLNANYHFSLVQVNQGLLGNNE